VGSGEFGNILIAKTHRQVINQPRDLKAFEFAVAAMFGYEF
jgi:hypothetical protein